MQSPKMMTRLCTLLGGGRSWAEHCGRLRGRQHRNEYIIWKQQPRHIYNEAGNASSIGPGARAASVQQDRAARSSRAFTSTTAAAAAYPAAAAASQQLWRIWMSLPAGLAVAATALYSSQDGMVTLPESEQQCSETMAAVARSVQATGEAIEVPTAGRMARSSRIGQLAVGKDDHIFVGLQQQELIKEYRCFFDKSGSRFHTVVHLGDNACGYPKTIHGGMTAAVLDECFGGLMLNLWRTGGLGLRAPMFTAKLEVNYKKKLPAGALVLCTATFSRLEGRKLWMDAQITDCSGQVVYATGRALFVSPRWSRMITDIARSWLPFQRGADTGISRART